MHSRSTGSKMAPAGQVLEIKSCGINVLNGNIGQLLAT